MVRYIDEDDSDSFISFNPVYSDDQHLHNKFNNNMNFVFDFELVYRRIPERGSDSDSEQYLDYDFLCNLETLIVHQTHEFDRDWLIGGDRDQIQATVYQILEDIQVPFYWDVIHALTVGILDLKKREAMSDSPKVDRVRVEIHISVPRFPGDDDDVDVKLAVAPASDEAVEKHFDTVVVVGNDDDEGYCVICMDTIRVGSGVAAGRMPCSHVFHRKCGEEWLKSSGICPVCRAVFPPL